MKYKFKNKNVGVYGIGISGISVAKSLYKLGANLTLIDSKKEIELKEMLKRIEGIKYNGKFNEEEIDISDLDLLVKSPGIPMSNDIIKIANKKGIEVITDLELYYRVSNNNNMILITGTNGKTTTTSLIGEIFKNAKKNINIAGNIGIGIMDFFEGVGSEDILIVEASSFQLESTVKLKPHVSILINVTPDHLDWHGSFDNYFKAKQKAFLNQTSEDFSILNYDDKRIRDFSKSLKSNVIFFSTKEKLNNGIYIEENKVYLGKNKDKKYLLDIEGISIIKENLLSSIATAYCYGIDMEIVKDTLENFKQLEHRMEFVLEINGIKFYNDSKGTNPESTIKALKTLKGPKVLIAGGYDKGADYKGLIDEIKKETKGLILLGETKKIIKKEALKHGFLNIYEVETMEEAVKKSYEIAKKGDKVILSPACASWGLYDNFKERGKDFKTNVINIGEKQYEKEEK